MFSLSSLSHLECLVAPDGDPDVVPVSDLLLVQQDQGWRGRLLGREAVSGSERLLADRPGGAGGITVGVLGQQSQQQTDPEPRPAPAIEGWKDQVINCTGT